MVLLVSFWCFQCCWSARESGDRPQEAARLLQSARGRRPLASLSFKKLAAHRKPITTGSHRVGLRNVTI
jgi:hypothetical protein